jgi:urease accessory protein
MLMSTRMTAHLVTATRISRKCFVTEGDVRMESAKENNFTVREDLAYLRLLHLADSALPIGALSHSFGLETLVAAEILNGATLPAFLHGYLREAGALEAVACREAFRLAGIADAKLRGARWMEINEYLSAFKAARESRAASAVLGRNFLQAALRLGDFPVLRDARDASLKCAGLIHHSAAFGLVSAALALDENRAVLAYHHQMTASLVSACQRLLPIGQNEATRMLWDLKPAIVEVSEVSAGCVLEEVNSFMPLLDWGAMEHPALATRLFIS